MIRQILVPLDGSALAEGVLPHAIRMARAFGSEALVLRVVGTRLSGVGHYIDTFDWRVKRVEAERYVERIAAQLRKNGVEARWRVAVGRASEEIVATARHERSDLVVMTTHGEGGRSEFHVSGTAAKVVGPADTSVLLVPPQETAAELSVGSYRRVLVPVDCSPRAEWALLLAGALARSAGAEVVLLYAATMPEAVGGTNEASESAALARRLRDANREAARIHLDQLVATLTGSGVRARVRVVESEDVARTIRSVADEEDASLVAMAAHGARATSEVPHGMVAASLLGHSTRPLLMLQDAPVPRATLTPETRTEVLRRTRQPSPGAL